MHLLLSFLFLVKFNGTPKESGIISGKWVAAGVVAGV